MTTTTENMTELTIPGAYSRVYETIAQLDNNQGLNPEDYPRPRQNYTARRRMWCSPLDEREHELLTLDNHPFRTQHGAGERNFRVPATETVIELAREQGKIVTVALVRDGNSPSYAEDYETSPEVKMTYPIKFYCDDFSGDIKMEHGEPYCDCREYDERNTCRHVRSRNNRMMVNRYLTRDTHSYHEMVDPVARARQEVENGIYQVNLSQADDRERNGVMYRVPSQARIQVMRRMIEDGNSVSLIAPDGMSRHYFGHLISGSLTLEASAKHRIVRLVDTLTCTCDEQRCSVYDNTVSFYKNLVLTRRYVVEQETNYASRFNSLMESDWQTQEEEVNSFLSQYSLGSEQSYVNNLNQFVADYREASERSFPLVYGYENVTNGVCAPGRKAFGVEIEFDRGNTHQIARELYEAGYAERPVMEGWHWNARTSRPYSTWSLEWDATVTGGEIVSPILHDTRETWEAIEKICKIITDNGGEASVRTGQHVHMGTVNRSMRSPRRRARNAREVSRANILSLYLAMEDSIHRVQTDPYRQVHRGFRWCSPMDTHSIRPLMNRLNEEPITGNDHGSSLNFGHPERIEFRGSDGTLDPAHIQAQVMVAAALVDAAERGGAVDAALDHQEVKRQTIGVNSRRRSIIADVLADSAQDDDELVASEASFVHFISALFDYDHGRRMMVGIAANTPWQ